MRVTGRDVPFDLPVCTEDVPLVALPPAKTSIEGDCGRLAGTSTFAGCLSEEIEIFDAASLPVAADSTVVGLETDESCSLDRNDWGRLNFGVARERFGMLCRWVFIPFKHINHF